MDAHRVGSHRCVDVAAAAAGDWVRRHTHSILRLGAGNVRVLTFHLLLDVGKLVHAWINDSVAEHRVSVVDADYWFLVVEESLPSSRRSRDGPYRCWGHSKPMMDSLALS